MEQQIKKTIFYGTKKNSYKYMHINWGLFSNFMKTIVPQNGTSGRSPWWGPSLWQSMKIVFVLEIVLSQILCYKWRL